MTTSTRRKETPAQPAQEPQDGPADPTAPGDTAEAPAGPEPTAEDLDEAASRRAQAEADAANPFRHIGRMLSGDYRAGYFAGQAAAGREDYPLTVHEAITEVTRQVPHIAKDRTASQGGHYKYRGIDDVLEALHPILADVGLVITPGRVIREAWETRATKDGGTLNVARLLIRYTLIGPDGTKHHAEVWGEGGDSGDKATQKAHSQSFKTMCLQTFSIPTQGSADDEPDATNPAARAWSAEELERATRARDAAHDAADLPTLGAARRRAEKLLGVPVQEPFGETVMPLSLYFDRRLAELSAPAAEGGE